MIKDLLQGANWSMQASACKQRNEFKKSQVMKFRKFQLRSSIQLPWNLIHVFLDILIRLLNAFSSTENMPHKMAKNKTLSPKNVRFLLFFHFLYLVTHKWFLFLLFFFLSKFYFYFYHNQHVTPMWWVEMRWDEHTVFLSRIKNVIGDARCLGIELNCRIFCRSFNSFSVWWGFHSSLLLA